MKASHALVALAAVLSLVALVSRSPARAEQIVRIEHHDPSATPARGPVDAPVIVELFYVPQVNLAARQLNAYKALEALQAKHPTRIRLIFRVMRQGMISTAALEAHAQGKYFEFLDRIAGERSALSREKLLELVKSIDLDPDRVAAAISQDRYAAAFNDNERRSRRLHLVNTPAVVFNSQPARFSMSSGNLRMDEVERTYAEAYERAVELMDQGIPAAKLGEVYDAKVLANAPPAVVSPAEDDNESHDQLLVSPPLKLAGLPSVGDDGTSMPIVFLCSPLNTQCQKIMERTINLQKDVYPELRLIWAPWFDVGREDASDQILLGDAALCAEQLGTGAPPKSAGWLWVEAMYRQLGQSRKGRITAQQRIDAIAKELDVDAAALAKCQAVRANASLDWLTAAHQAGIRVSPSVVIGGRIYAALIDPSTLQGLVEAELAPGISDALHEHLGRWPR